MKKLLSILLSAVLCASLIVSDPVEIPKDITTQPGVEQQDDSVEDGKVSLLDDSEKPGLGIDIQYQSSME